MSDERCEVLHSIREFERKAARRWAAGSGGSAATAFTYGCTGEASRILGSQAEEQFLDHWLMEQVQTAGSSA